MSEITRDDLRETAQDIKEVLGGRIGNLENEVRGLRTSVDAHGRDLAEYKTKTTNLEREVFNGGKRRNGNGHGTAPTVAPVKQLVAGVVAIGALAEGFHQAFGWLKGWLFR